MFEKIPVDKIGVTNKRLTNLEYLGQDMIEAGNEFGAGTPYGKNDIIGPWWWSSGQRPRLQLRRSEFESC